MSNVTPLHPAPQTCMFGFTSDQALDHFETLRGDESCIHQSKHLHDQMDLRAVTITQVMSALRNGKLEKNPHMGPENCWRAQYRDFVAGDDISVVAQLEQNKMGEFLVIVTVIHHAEIEG